MSIATTSNRIGCHLYSKPSQRFLSKQQKPIYWFESFSRYKGPQKVIVYSRVSTEQQKRQGSLHRRTVHLCSRLHAKGHHLTDVFSEVRGREDRSFGQLANAIELSWRTDAIIVAHSWDRFIRPEVKRAVSQGLLPSNSEFFDLYYGIADGLSLATLWSPRLCWEEIKRREKQFAGPIRSSQTGNRYSSETMQIAETLYQRIGSYRKVADKLCVSKSAVQRWCA